MRCPGCGSSLQTESFEGLQIDTCPTCHGVWFDEGELGEFLKKTPTSLNAFNEKHRAEPEKVSAASRLCPRCNTGLESYRYLYNSPIIIDSCPQCMGIFVGPGEITQIEGYAAASKVPQPGEEASLMVANMEIKAELSKQRTRASASSVLTRRISNSWAWWELSEPDTDIP